MSDKPPDTQELESVARLLIQNPEQPSVQRQYTILLSAAWDIDTLHEFASRFTPHPEVSVPAYTRLLQLQPENAAYHVELGFVHYMCGEDDQAQQCAQRVRELKGDSVDGLMLEAALARDPDQKKKLFTRIVMIDPKNRVAFDNLIMLRKQ